jgi:Protein of unknown function (DUF2958)
MKLLTAELRLALPELYETEGVPTEEKKVLAKFFYPAGRWTWFVVEGSEREDDFIFFGYVIGQAEEWGYFSLRELESISINGLEVERDLYFAPGRFKEVIQTFRSERS